MLRISGVMPVTPAKGPHICSIQAVRRHEESKEGRRIILGIPLRHHAAMALILQSWSGLFQKGVTCKNEGLLQYESGPRFLETSICVSQTPTVARSAQFHLRGRVPLMHSA